MKAKAIATTSASIFVDISKHTPMMQQYWAVKNLYPSAIVFFRMGDFFEIFYDDAKTAAQILNITLTYRGQSAGENIPMAGMPASSVQQYQGRLLHAGFTVVMCDQINSVENIQHLVIQSKVHVENTENTENTKDEINKNVKNKIPKLIERKVTQILTPGTITDPSLLLKPQETWLLSLFFEKNYTHFIWCSVASGECRHIITTIDQTLSTLTRINPSEIIVAEKQYELLCHLFLGQKFENFNTTMVIKNNLKKNKFSHIKQLPDWHFNGLSAQKRFYETRLWHESKTMNVSVSGWCAFGGLSYYTQTTQQQYLSHIQDIIIEQPNDFIALDARTRLHLELTQNAVLSGQQQTTLLQSINRCQTAMGTRLLTQWIHQPLRNQVLALQRQTIITALKQHYEKSNHFSNTSNSSAPFSFFHNLSQCADVSRLAGRIALNQIKPRELLALKQTLMLIPLLLEQFLEITKKDTPTNVNPLQELIIDGLNSNNDDNNDNNDNNDDNLNLVTLLATIHEETPNHLREGKIFNDNVNTILDECRHLQKGVDTILQELEFQEREKTGFNNLRIAYNSLSGFYIELPLSVAAQVPTHYIRRQTLKNNERYITEELKILEEKVLTAHQRAISQEQHLYIDLLTQLQVFVPILQKMGESIAMLDVLTGLAKLAADEKWCPPTLGSEHIEIIGGWHPVLVHQLGGNSKSFTKNSTVLTRNNHFLLLTGPNMGGKSTYMRQTVLIVLLAWMGSYVPSATAEIPEIDAIFTRIGASDDLGSGQSTFMVEMNETATILQHATTQSLILMDEVGRGTSTHEGQALAQAIAEYLLYENKCWTLFATHYFALTDWAELQSRAQNICVQVKEKNDEIVFLHQISAGRSTHSYGVAVAQLAGVPKKVVLRAKEITNKEQNLKLSIQPDLFFNNNVSTNNARIEELEKTIEQFSYIQAKLKNLAYSDEWNLKKTLLWIDELKELI